MTEDSKDVWVVVGIAATMFMVLGFALKSRLIEGFTLGVLLCVIGRFVEGRER